MYVSRRFSAVSCECRSCLRIASATGIDISRGREESVKLAPAKRTVDSLAICPAPIACHVEFVLSYSIVAVELGGVRQKVSEGVAALDILLQ